MEVGRPDFDIAIVGGGPAGASAAITAARAGARVALLEAGDFPRQKVCGEFVSAESLGVLSELFRDHDHAQLVIQDAPVIAQTRLFLGTRLVDAPVDPPALSIPRYTLDALLWEAAQHTGACARSSCEVTAIDGDGPFTLTTSQGILTSSSVIQCTGRWSRFSGKASIPSGPKWIGLKAHFRERAALASTDLYFFDHGYCGVQPVASDAVNACALIRSDCATTLQEVFSLSPLLSSRALQWQPLMETVTTAPLFYRTPQPVRSNLLLAGDAAGFIDPFAGDGISIALRSGRAAARQLCRYVRGDLTLPEAAAAYQRDYDHQFAPLIAAASRVRRLMSLPTFLHLPVFELMRLPGLIPYLIRKTRQA